MAIITLLFLILGILVVPDVSTGSDRQNEVRKDCKGYCNRKNLPLSAFQTFPQRDGSIGWRHKCAQCRLQDDRNRRSRNKNKTEDEVEEVRAEKYPTGRKKCARCKKERDFDCFYKCPSNKDWLYYICNECSRKEVDEHATANKARSKEVVEAIRVERYKDGKKTCCDCKENLELQNFTIARRNYDGLSGHCRCCDKERKSRYFNRTLEELFNDIIKFLQLGDMSLEAATKSCHSCNKTKPINEFAVFIHNACGVRSSCNDCLKNYRKTREEKRHLVINEFKARGCMNCPCKDPECLNIVFINNYKRYRSKYGKRIRAGDLTLKQFEREKHNIRVICAYCHRLELFSKTKSKAHNPLRDLVNIEKKRRGCCARCSRAVIYNGTIGDNVAGFDFDHLPGYEKIMDISKMVHLNCKREVVIVEMSKCDLLCVNCHRTVTHERLPEYPRTKSCGVLDAYKHYLENKAKAVLEDIEEDEEVELDELDEADENDDEAEFNDDDDDEDEDEDDDGEESDIAFVLPPTDAGNSSNTVVTPPASSVHQSTPKAQCKGTKRDGMQCSRNGKSADFPYCYQHVSQAPK